MQCVFSVSLCDSMLEDIEIEIARNLLASSAGTTYLALKHRPNKVSVFVSF